MTTPKSVTEHPEMDWINVGDQAWITANVRDAETDLGQVYVAHLDPMYDVECPHSPHSIRDVTVEARRPLTVVGLKCPRVQGKKWCSWAGSIREGHWEAA